MELPYFLFTNGELFLLGIAGNHQVHLVAITTMMDVLDLKAIRPGTGIPDLDAGQHPATQLEFVRTRRELSRLTLICRLRELLSVDDHGFEPLVAICRNAMMGSCGPERGRRGDTYFNASVKPRAALLSQRRWHPCKG